MVVKPRCAFYCWRVDMSLSIGAQIQIIRYAQNPTLPHRSAIRKMMRMTVGSTLRYLANPPQTPAILRSL